MDHQSFSSYDVGENPNGIWLDDYRFLKSQKSDQKLYLYTQHEIFLGKTLQQTRSSPNWQGGLTTFATCKHHMRTFNNDWSDMWIAGLCPAALNNAVLFCGKIKKLFKSNYDLSRWLKRNNKEAFKAKQANKDPRGDLYKPKAVLSGEQVFNHENFVKPKNHTRSLEYYSKSPGSVSIRLDGKIPKWWRDIEYTKHPPVFILDPVVLFTQPTVLTSYEPKRATLSLTLKQFTRSLRKS